MVSCCRPDRGSSVISHARSSQLTEWPRLLETACPLIVGRLSNLDIARSQFQRAGSTGGACSATGHNRCHAKKTNVRQPAPSRNPQLHDSSLADASASLAECYLRPRQQLESPATCTSAAVAFQTDSSCSFGDHYQLTKALLSQQRRNDELLFV